MWGNTLRLITFVHFEALQDYNVVEKRKRVASEVGT